jgi:predicted RNA-binding protein with PUA-like domain
VEVGDGILFYHSNSKPTGVVGTCEVVKAGYPDDTARDPQSEYFDPRATPDDPRWYMVDVKLKEKFEGVVTLAELKATPGLEDMMVCRKGSRLSIQPVRASEWKTVRRLGKKQK